MLRRPRLLLPATILAAGLLVSACATFATDEGMGHSGPGTGPGMMGGGGGSTSAAPGTSGFVAGTPDAPRIVRILAGPGFQFAPSTVTIAAGETITFDVTTIGPAVHEFKVGPLDAVLADGDAPEINDIAIPTPDRTSRPRSGSRLTQKPWSMAG